MTVDTGFILLSRSIVDSIVFQNEKWFRVWIWCLIEASYKKKNKRVKTGKGYTVLTLERGQFIFGRNQNAKDLKLPPSTLWKIILKLKTLGNLNIKSNTHYSIISICNYELYQELENYQVTSKGTTKEQPRNNQGTHLKERKERKERNTTTLPPEPENFKITDNLRKWSDKKGISSIDLESYIETCLIWHGSKGNKYSDWSKAIQNWINKDLKDKPEINKYDFL